ncbi:PilW family protein [Massilia sp. GCM10020059]|uniref:PilW family protein n=1 Tax=Massilia agrisoli TaxID=2892444 RepID=A0ABS8IW64_9BURK|nr:PilW family protein [Massilia agrisoli]MCC6072779.1 PilW family protein [Massilia agrisoli]
MTSLRQRGLTLVELMVAITIGLLVLLFAAAMLISANRGHAAQEEAARLDDSGRFALEVIARAVRQTAYVNWDRADAGIADDPTAPPRVVGMDNRSLVKTADFISDPRPDVANGSDVLALRFAGAGAGPDGDGSMTSCAGFGVSELEEGWSIFYVGRSAVGDTELRCKYRGSTSWGADAIVGGVDSFQVLYGLDTDVPADGLANLFVNASVVSALDDGLTIDGANETERELDLRRKTYWKRVASIKVGLILHGEKRVRMNAQPIVFDVFGPAYADALGSSDPGTRISESDMPGSLRERERRLFSSTIMLRNPPR